MLVGAGVGIDKVKDQRADQKDKKEEDERIARFVQEDPRITQLGTDEMFRSLLHLE